MKKVFSILIKISILISTFSFFLGCNLCPNNTDDATSQDELVISYSSLNGNSILVLSNILSLSFREIISDVSVHSAFAENGDFCFIQKNYQNSNSAMFMANIYKKNQIFLEIENQIFSIINPVISPKSNAIAFAGGKKQLYIWVNNPVNKTSYIDKITNTFLESSIPTFTSEGKFLCFLEQEHTTLTLSVIDIQKPDETIKKFLFYGQDGIFGQETKLSLTENGIIFFISNDDYNYYFNLIDLVNNSVSKYELSKNVLQITTGEISWDGKKALLVSNEGVIWGVSFRNKSIKMFQLTKADNCSKYVDVRWKKNSNTFLAFRINCDNTIGNTKKLYIMSVDEGNDEIKLGSNIYFTSNVVNAYWR